MPSSGNPSHPPLRGGVPNYNLFGWLLLSKGMPQCRDRRPRLSAPTVHLTLQAASSMRTDEGVCPYCEADSSINERDLLQFKIQSS